MLRPVPTQAASLGMAEPCLPARRQVLRHSDTPLTGSDASQTCSRPSQTPPDPSRPSQTLTDAQTAETCISEAVARHRLAALWRKSRVQETSGSRQVAHSCTLLHANLGFRCHPSSPLPSPCTSTSPLRASQGCGGLRTPVFAVRLPRPAQSDKTVQSSWRLSDTAKSTVELSDLSQGAHSLVSRHCLRPLVTGS